MAIAALPAVHVKVTVALELIHPFALGAGETLAEMVGGVPTPNVSWLLACPATLTTTGPVVAPLEQGQRFACRSNWWELRRCR